MKITAVCQTVRCKIDLGANQVTPVLTNKQKVVIIVSTDSSSLKDGGNKYKASSLQKDIGYQAGVAKW